MIKKSEQKRREERENMKKSLRKATGRRKGGNTIRIFHWSTLSVCVCVHVCGCEHVMP